MNVIDRIRKREGEFSEFVAVIDGDCRLTYRELYDRVDRLSNALLDLGVSKGDRLMAWLPNCYQAIETELACFQIGAVWVTLNTGLTWQEVDVVVASTEPKVLVTTPELLAKVGAPKATDSAVLDELPMIVVMGGESGAGSDYESVIAEAKAERPKIDVGENDLARLRYTSGTTGKMKAAMLSHRAYLASMENLENELPPLGPEDRALHAAPLTHASAAYMYPIFAAGGANVILPKFEAEAVLETIERERISVMFVVPTILHRLSVSLGFETRDLSSLRSVSYGGAPTPPGMLAPALKKLGTALLHIYGLTEALHPTTTLHREEHWDGNPLLGSVGKPTKMCELEVRDEEGVSLSAGEVGEFFVRGPIAMDGYWRDAEGTAEVMKDGWVATGDLGYRDENGYYWIVDRKKDVIISGGLNVYSKEVEAVLCDHADVSEAAVVGIPHVDWGEQVYAVVHARPGSSLDESELRVFCKSALAGYKRPKGYTIVEDALPRNSAGKILKPELLELVRKRTPVR